MMIMTCMNACVCLVSSQAHSKGPYQGLRRWKPGYQRSWTWGVCHWVRAEAARLSLVWAPHADLHSCFSRERKQSWSISSSSWAKSSPSCLSSPALWPSRKGFVQFSALFTFILLLIFTSGSCPRQQTHSLYTLDLTVCNVLFCSSQPN